MKTVHLADKKGNIKTKNIGSFNKLNAYKTTTPAINKSNNIEIKIIFLFDKLLNKLNIFLIS